MKRNGVFIGWRAATVLLLLTLTGCAIGPSGDSKFTGGPAELEFVGTEHVDNPLIGQFWSPNVNDFVPWEEVARYMPHGGWLMLGEQHDHPDHHALQTYFIYYLAERGLLGHVGMEMIAANQQAAIDSYRGAANRVRPGDLDWPARGWPWDNYAGQVEAALERSSGLVFGDLSDTQKNELREQVSNNEEPIAHYSDVHTQFLAELIVVSHCNMFTMERALPMVDMQIARDQLMAQQMIAHALPGRVGVFIAGSGHVRADYGAPLWIAESVPVRTLILVGVNESTNPRDYLKATGVSKQLEYGKPADLLFFVPGIPAEDYCAAFRS
ncbi:MAG: ChaN family lipoprotein [Idiomarina sp.]|nr:ChaN family lipoprotein [Idiomarina sp.]